MRRTLFIILGLICVALACLGIVLPGLPATPFLLLAASCFAKSSPRLHKFLLNNPVFAPIIINWQKTRSIPRRAKIISIFMILIVGTFSVIMMESYYQKLLIVALLLFPLLFISRLRETESLRQAAKEPADGRTEDDLK